MADIEMLRAQAKQLAREASDVRQKGVVKDTLYAYVRSLDAASAYIEAAPDAPDAEKWKSYIEQVREWFVTQNQAINETQDASGSSGGGGGNDDDDDDDGDAPKAPKPKAQSIDDIADNWQDFLEYNKKGGTLASNSWNASLYLHFHEDIRGKVRWNEFAKQIEIDGLFGLPPDARIELFVTAAREWLYATAAINASPRDIESILDLVAFKNRYNPLVDYLTSLRWDGTPRIDTFFEKYLGAKLTSDDGKDITDHVRRVSRRWFISAVARAMSPGCQVDTVLILEGDPGLRKSSAFAVLGGTFACATEMKISGDKDSKLLASSAWIIELAELHSLEGRKSEAVKSFITHRFDSYRPVFGRQFKHVPRSCILVGTVNRRDGEGYIEEDEGLFRRFWPVTVEKIDITAIENDRDQLWAEALAIFSTRGPASCEKCAAIIASTGDERHEKLCADHRWWLYKNEQRDASMEASARSDTPMFGDKIINWWLGLGASAMSARSVDPSGFTFEEVAEHALKMPIETWPRWRTAVGRTLTSLGFVKGQETTGRRRRVYAPGPALVKSREERTKIPQAAPAPKKP